MLDALLCDDEAACDAIEEIACRINTLERERTTIFWSSAWAGRWACVCDGSVFGPFSTKQDQDAFQATARIRRAALGWFVGDGNVVRLDNIVGVRMGELATRGDIVTSLADSRPGTYVYVLRASTAGGAMFPALVDTGFQGGVGLCVTNREFRKIAAGPVTEESLGVASTAIPSLSTTLRMRELHVDAAVPGSEVPMPGHWLPPNMYGYCIVGVQAMSRSILMLRDGVATFSDADATGRVCVGGLGDLPVPPEKHS